MIADLIFDCDCPGAELVLCLPLAAVAWCVVDGYGADGLPGLLPPSLQSGSIRLWDGQTLILTGVVSETQVEEVRKRPILGDLPLLGSLFSSSESTRTKDEFDVLVTPRVLDDDQGDVFGYGYRPTTQQATQLMQNGS